MEEPVNEFKLLRDQDLAAKAEQLLGSSLLRESFEKLEQNYMKAWRDTGTAEGETLKREKLWMAINLIGKVQEHLNIIVQNGKLAKAHLAQITRKNAA